MKNNNLSFVSVDALQFLCVPKGLYIFACQTKNCQPTWSFRGIAHPLAQPLGNGLCQPSPVGWYWTVLRIGHGCYGRVHGKLLLDPMGCFPLFCSSHKRNKYGPFSRVYVTVVLYICLNLKWSSTYFLIIKSWVHKIKFVHVREGLLIGLVVKWLINQLISNKSTNIRTAPA